MQLKKAIALFCLIVVCLQVLPVKQIGAVLFNNQITEEIARAVEAPHAMGPDGPLYPGTCRRLSPAERDARIAKGDSFALRLDAAKAAASAGPAPGARARNAGSISVPVSPAL